MSIERTGLGGFVAPTGVIVPFAGSAAVLNTSLPSGWLLCDGRNTISQSTYQALFNTIVPLMGTPTFTNGSANIILVGHGLVVGDTVYFTDSGGTLPTNFALNTLYYVVTSATTFQVSATRGGLAVTAGSAGTGTPSIYYCPYGLGSTTSNFALPDLRGRLAIGSGTGTATAASAWAMGNTPTSAAGGEETHLLTGPESGIQTHSHSSPDGYPFILATAGTPAGGLAVATGGHYVGANTANAGPANASNAHNNMQPLVVVNYIIKY